MELENIKTWKDLFEYLKTQPEPPDEDEEVIKWFEERFEPPIPKSV